MFCIIQENEKISSSFSNKATLVFSIFIKNKIIFEDLNFYNKTIRIIYLPFSASQINTLYTSHPFLFKKFYKNLLKITNKSPVFLFGSLDKSILSTITSNIRVNSSQIFKFFIKKAVKKGCDMFKIDSLFEEVLILSYDIDFYIKELKDIIRHFAVYDDFDEDIIENYYTEYGISIKNIKTNALSPKICIADGNFPSIYTKLVFDIQNNLPYLHNVIKLENLYFSVPLPFKIVSKKISSLSVGFVICLIYTAFYENLSFDEFIEKFEIDLTGIIKPKF